MENLFKIGLIVKPQGIKGELKVQPFTDDINRFKNFKKLSIDETVYRVLGVKVIPNAVLLRLSGIEDRNTAESFRGKFVCVDRIDVGEPEEGRYYIVDVIGCSLVSDSNETIGTITDVTSSNTDIITVKTLDGKIMRFPFLKDLVCKIDVEKKVFSVKEQRLKQVACYED